jgi:DNA replication and repair protein RecF
LLRLELRNYRNYGRLDLEPAPGLNLFLGANGQGKTNLLESVALLALGSSPRARRDAELIGPLASEARVLGVLESAGLTREARISVVSEGDRARRRIEVDGQPRRAVDLPGLFRVTLFWPDDLDLVKAGPEHRRRMLNQMLVQTRQGYARSLTRYTRVVEQRNALLKRIAGGEHPPSALDVWDEEMTRLGALLTEARAGAVLALGPAAAENHAAISGGERLEIEYQGPPDDLGLALEHSRPDDIRRGVSTVGPHRDDLVIRLDGRDARSFGSQGQQRTAVASLKLAEAQVVAEVTGESPVVLLDDVLSELDAVRRVALLERVGGPGQVVVTSVEADPFPTLVLGRSRVHRIARGEVVACG